MEAATPPQAPPGSPKPQFALEDLSHFHPASLDFLGEWKRSVVPLRRQFLESHNSPFSHVVIDNFFTNETAEKLLEEFPHPDEALWHRYHNPLEKKLACNNLSLLRDTTRSVLRALNSLEVISLISDISGIDKLAADPYLHGGGLHCHLPAGKLDVHLDYSVHPLLPQFERRLNLIVYLSKGWRDEYGGKIELWHSSMSHCVKKIAPMFNRAVLFSTSDLSYHGLPDPLKCPEGESRRSLATYYLAPLRASATHRFKAQFVPRPSDKPSELLDKLRQIRPMRRIEASDLPPDWERLLDD